MYYGFSTSFDFCWLVRCIFFFFFLKGNLDDACSIYEQAIAIEKGKEHSQCLPLLFAQYSRFCYLVKFFLSCVSSFYIFDSINWLLPFQSCCNVPLPSCGKQLQILLSFRCLWKLILIFCLPMCLFFVSLVGGSTCHYHFISLHFNLFGLLSFLVVWKNVSFWIWQRFNSNIPQD